MVFILQSTEGQGCPQFGKGCGVLPTLVVRDHCQTG